LLVSMGFKIREYYLGHLIIPTPPSVTKWPQIPSPRGIAYPKQPKPVVPEPSFEDVQRGIAEPHGAPYGNGNNAELHKKFAEYDGMSVVQMRRLLALDIQKLKDLLDKWEYGAAQSLDGPPVDKILTPEESKQYNDQMELKRHTELVLRPKRRYDDFVKELPELPILVQYLMPQYPGTEYQGCFPTKDHMEQYELSDCADYLQKVLEQKYPRPLN
jgi:hypothetical protein